jgi:photosystem II stability/assembly factor-like uncharacterized protein
MIFLRYLPAWPQQVWFFALALVDLLLHISLLHMKKSIFLLTALLTLALFTYFWKSGSAGSGLRLAPAPPEENAELREAWEKKMLADPNTGDIPAGIEYQERWATAGIPWAVESRDNVPWASRGPWNVGGRTRALAFDVTNENRLLAGAVAGGLWLSEDGGQSWTRKTPIQAHPGCISIAQDTRPGKTNTWYYLSGEIYGTSASGGNAFYLGDGLFKSTDNGETWAQVASTAGGNPQSFSTLYQGGWRVVTSPTDTSDVLYMATVGAIYRSANGGNTWTAVRGGNLSDFSYFTDVAITSTGVLYATLSDDGPAKGIWRSVNGTSWTNILPANFPAKYNRITIGINPDNENEVYFLGETPGTGVGNFFISDTSWTSLWKYTYLGGDGAGANGQWENRSANLPSSGTEFDRFACQGGYDLVVKVQPGTGHVFVGGTNLYRSDDAFTSANNTTHIGGYKPGTFLPYFELYPNHHPDQHDILFLPSNPQVAVTASDGGLHRTENVNAAQVNWSYLNNGYLSAQFYTAIFDKSAPNDEVLIGGLQDNGNFMTTSADPQSLWKQTVNGDGAYGFIPEGKPYYILSIQQGRIAKCAIDNSGNITAFERIDPIGRKKENYQFINPFAADPSNEKILYLPAGNQFYRQDDLDAIPLTNTWDSISLGWNKFPDTLANADLFSAIGVSKNNPAHRVYLGTEKNKLYRIDNAHTGTPSMTTLTPPIGNASAYVSCIAVDPDNADDVIVVYSNYGVYSIWRSQNGGQNWQKVAGNLETSFQGSGGGPSIRWMSILPFPDGSRRYYCGTSVGLYSTDSLKLHVSQQVQGTQWLKEAPNLIGNSVVPYVDVRPSDGMVVAATHSIGMFAAKFSSSVRTSEPSGTPLIRVGPNPVGDILRVQCADNLEEKTLEVFDLKGRPMVQTTFSGNTFETSLAEAPAGVYLYRVRGKGWQKSGKLIKN